MHASLKRAGLLLAAACALAQQQPVNRGASVLSEFEKSVAEYVKLRKTWTKDVPKLKPTNFPNEIKSNQARVAASIQKARPGARQGEFFTPQIATEFKRLIALTLAGPNASRIRESLGNVEAVPLKLGVNQRYPESIPLQSTPSTLLMNLPKLPPELDYRPAAGNLILRDVDANLVIDFIPNAIR